MRFSDLACKFPITSDSQTNKDYVTLYLATLETWENRASSTLTDNTNVDFLNIVKQKSLEICKGQINVSTITKVSSALLRTANPIYTHSRL